MKKYKLFILILTVGILTACSASGDSKKVVIHEQTLKLKDILNSEEITSNEYNDVAEYILWAYVDDYIKREKLSLDKVQEYYKMSNKEWKELVVAEREMLESNYLYQTAIEQLFEKLVKVEKKDIKKYEEEGKNVNMLFLQGIMNMDYLQEIDKLDKDERLKAIAEFERVVVEKGVEYQQKFAEDELTQREEEIENGIVNVVVYTPTEEEHSHGHAKEIAVGESKITDDLFVDVMYKIEEVKMSAESLNEQIKIDKISEQFPYTRDLLLALEKIDKNFTIGEEVKTKMAQQIKEQEEETKKKLEENLLGTNEK